MALLIINLGVREFVPVYKKEFNR